MTNTNKEILASFFIYAVIIYLIAFISTRKTKNIADYMLGGRKLSGPITALGAGASDMSSWLLMALPGAVYLTGLNVIWMPIALAIGAYLNWTLVGKRLRVYTEIANDSLTIPAFLDNRFKSQNHSLRLVTAIAIIIFFTMYSVSGFVSGAVLTQLTFGLDYQTSLLVGAAVVVIYTVIGGFLAVNRIDFFQGILMLIALITVPVVTATHLFADNTNWINTIDPAKLNILKEIKILGIISLAAWGLGYFGQPHILVRFMAIRSAKEIPIARLICMVWMIVALIGAVATGFVGISYFSASSLENHETVFIQLSKILFNPWVTGLLLSAIISAIMSTISALILMSGSAIAEDFYRAFIRKKASDKEYLLASRISVVLVAVIAILIASNPGLTILNSVAFAWSGLGAAFGPIILFSLYWKNTTRLGAIAGIITGTITVIGWDLLAKYVGGVFNHPDIMPGFSILPGYILSSIAIVSVSKLCPDNNQSIYKEFEKAKGITSSL